MNKDIKGINIILMGFGNVGQAFLRVLREKNEFCRTHYGLDLRVLSVFRSSGAFFSSQPMKIDEILEYSVSSQKSPDWKPDLKLVSVLESFEPGVLVECTPFGSKSGEPGLSHIRDALERGWHVVTANKSPLVFDFQGLLQKAKKNHVDLKFSGATAAALPTLDVALYSLAGTEISRIEGILNGTTNYILTRLKEGASYSEALAEAQSKGIAETDPSLDVSGWDTAAKILIISNAVVKTDLSLDDVIIQGIESIPPRLLDQGREKNKALKLLGKLWGEAGEYQLEVVLTVIDDSYPLFGVDGTNKGIVFFTDTMNSITVIGGRSDPKGTGAALLKDIINIYRE
jgi:homoserine dehydrogenase